MGYADGTGKYQERFDYYRLHADKNRHIYIFDAIRKLYYLLIEAAARDEVAEFFEFDNETVLQPIKIIRDMQGLARCWGHALTLLEMIAENSCEYSEMVDIASSLIDRYMEILPAYTQWVPECRLPGNQDLVDMLHRRANMYRVMNNNKLFTYEKVIDAIVDCDYQINAGNCKYLAHAEPRVIVHIKEILQTLKPPATDREVTNHQQLLVEALYDAGYNKLAKEIYTEKLFPQTEDEFRLLDNYHDDAVYNLFNNQVPGCPPATNWRNLSLLTWLWKKYAAGSKRTRPKYQKFATAVAKSREYIGLYDLEYILSRNLAQTFLAENSGEMPSNLYIEPVEPPRKRRAK